MNTTKSATAAAVTQALRAAIRAPSPHNTQPWRFEVSPGRIDLLLDRERTLPVADPTAREARLACGAALFNLRLALRMAGLAVRYDLQPDRDRPDLLARVRFGGKRAPDPEERVLATAIERRATNRRPFIDSPVPARLRWNLVRAADLEGGRLVLLEQPSQLGAFADLLRRADHRQEQHPPFQAELRQWTATHTGREDGVPRSAGGPRPDDASVLKLRRYEAHESAVERPFEQDPLVAILATTGDTALGQVRGGQALQRVLLTATVDGLGVSFLSQPVEFDDTRDRLRDLVGGRLHPQTALRVGYGYAASATPRRPVDAVTTMIEEPRP